MVGRKVDGQILFGARSEKLKILFGARGEKPKKLFGAHDSYGKIYLAVKGLRVKRRCREVKQCEMIRRMSGAKGF